MRLTAKHVRERKPEATTCARCGFDREAHFYDVAPESMPVELHSPNTGLIEVCPVRTLGQRTLWKGDASE